MMRQKLAIEFRSHSRQCGSDLLGDLMTAIGVSALFFLAAAGMLFK